MHVIEPERYQAVPKRGIWWPYVAAPVVVLVILGTINYLRPLPEPTVSWSLQTPTTGAKPVLSWPAVGQAAVAAEGYGPLDSYGTQTPFSTASMAKVILAMCVLQKQPMTLGQTGQTYTITAHDVALYQNYVEQDGSLLPVVSGEQLTEYQALQALMLPSANNIADSLTTWVFGGQDAYATYAANWLQQNGLDNTHIGPDASGFDPGTTSTASDLAQLGLLAAKDPVLMEIAGQGTANLPIAGTVWNYDTVRGQSGIDGLKTGNNNVDTGAFLFTATTVVGGKTVRLSGSVMGAPDLNTALQDSVQLAASAERGFQAVTIAKASQAVGNVQTAWGASSPIVTGKAVQLVRWASVPVTQKHQINPRLRSGEIGTLKSVAGPDSANTSLHLSHALAGPGFWWRLTRH